MNKHKKHKSLIAIYYSFNTKSFYPYQWTNATINDVVSWEYKPGVHRIYKLTKKGNLKLIYSAEDN